MDMLKEFKEFALKGNVVDLAIAVIIGAAFGKIITSLVNDIIMPPFGMLLGGVNFTDLFISLDGQTYPSLAVATAAGAPTINYGIFLNNIISFLIITWVLYLIVKAMNAMKKAPAPAPAEPVAKTCPQCATEIPIKAVRCPHCTSNL
jgi:large conductance mechanosensitive channel